MATTPPPVPLAPSLGELTALPRPVYGRVDTLPNVPLGFRHRHAWGQLAYALQGVLEVRTDRGLFVVPPERAVWIAPQVPHRVFCPSPTQIRSLYLDAALGLREGAGCHVIGISPLLRELIRAFSQRPVLYDHEGADGRLVAVLLDQLRAAPEQALMLPWPADPALRRICRRLHAHPDDRTSLAEWAVRLGLSEKTLSRRFRQDTGLTFRAWRQRLRLLAALPAVERGERVTDIALACGYDSLSAFIAAFRQHFGSPPGDFARGRTPV